MAGLVFITLILVVYVLVAPIVLFARQRKLNRQLEEITRKLDVAL